MIHCVIHLKFIGDESFELNGAFESNGGGNAGGGDVFLEGVAETAVTGDDFVYGGEVWVAIEVLTHFTEFGDEQITAVFLSGLSDCFLHFDGVVFPEDGGKDGVEIVVEEAVGEGAGDIGNGGDMVELVLQGVEMLTVFFHDEGDESDPVAAGFELLHALVDESMTAYDIGVGKAVRDE